MTDLLRRKNDILLKSAFEEAFPDLLRFFFVDADAIFQMDKGFEFMDKELRELFPELEKSGGSRYVDMLAKTYLKNGNEEWILIHIEIEGGDATLYRTATFGHEFTTEFTKYGTELQGVFFAKCYFHEETQLIAIG